MLSAYQLFAYHNWYLLIWRLTDHKLDGCVSLERRVIRSSGIICDSQNASLGRFVRKIKSLNLNLGFNQMFLCVFLRAVFCSIFRFLWNIRPIVKRFLCGWTKRLDSPFSIRFCISPKRFCLNFFINKKLRPVDNEIIDDVRNTKMFPLANTHWVKKTRRELFPQRSTEQTSICYVISCFKAIPE